MCSWRRCAGPESVVVIFPAWCKVYRLSVTEEMGRKKKIRKKKSTVYGGWHQLWRLGLLMWSKTPEYSQTSSAGMRCTAESSTCQFMQGHVQITHGPAGGSRGQLCSLSSSKNNTTWWCPLCTFWWVLLWLRAAASSSGSGSTWVGQDLFALGVKTEAETWALRLMQPHSWLYPARQEHSSLKK